MGVLRAYADVLEQVSIDEAFLDVSSRVPSFDAAETYAKRVKAAVRKREGLACTIGVAPNKSAAKIASDLSKPDGLRVVRPEELAGFLAPLPVTMVSGVGTKTAQVLHQVGVTTIGDLLRLPGRELKALLGKNAVWLRGIARGLERMPVEERPNPKSISVERTFDEDIGDWIRLREILDDLALNVYRRAEAQGAAFRTIGIKVRFEGFETHLRERSLPSHVLDLPALQGVLRELAREFEGCGRAVRLLGVRVAHLVRPGAVQVRLTAFDSQR